jgi:hypothetical protein
MKLFKITMLLLVGAFACFSAAGQANASINILTQNSGQVYPGATVFVQVDIGNTGPGSVIGANKVRARISVPSAIVSIPTSGHVLPAGWTITTNTGDVITICNGSDIIGVNEVRTLLIAVQGNTLGGPSTITGLVLFSNGTNCNVTGTLAGDQTADNTSTSSVEVIPAPACTLGVTASAGIINCNGGTTTLTATPTGAIGTVEYSITGAAPFQAGNTFTVSAGTYTVTSRQTNNPGCIATATPVTIVQPAIVTAPVISAITQPNCTIATGGVDLSGLPAGNWTITRNPGGIITNGAGANTTISGLAPGNYTFTVSNAAGCTSTASSNVVITAQSIPTAPTVNVVQPTCTITTGIITITSTTAGLTFSLDGNAYAAYPTNGYTTTAGPHTITAQDSNGCISPVTNIMVNTQPATPAAPVAGAITQPTCVISTGSVILNGLPAGNWIINPGAIAGNTVTTTVNGLAAGTYNFTVINAAGCTSITSADILINNVPGAPAAPTFNIDQPTCTVATGTITITSTTIGLTFSLDGGNYTAYPAVGYIVPAGPHTLTVQNTANCTSPVANILVNAQPLTPGAPIVNVAQPTCIVTTGIITITSDITGLTFSLDASSYATYPAGGYMATTGPHTLKAQTGSGCISPVTNITVNAQPAAPSLSVLPGAIACNGGSTTLTATVTGGTSPFQYSLDGITFQPANLFTVNAGVYTVTVRDANLCTGTTTVSVTEPAALTASVSQGSVACNSGTTTLVVTTTGGTAPLQYSLNGGAYQSANTFAVATGIYRVTVKDANLCTVITAPVTITQPAVLTASATARRITQCGGTTIVTVSASGGLLPYQPDGIGTFARGPGTWIFSVTDAGGCTDTTQITIEAPGCMDLKVYPNPAKSTIIIDHSAASTGSAMQVFDINGAQVLTKAVSQDAIQTTIDIGKLAAGTYVIVYLNGNEKKETLFVKVSSN